MYHTILLSNNKWLQPLSLPGLGAVSTSIYMFDKASMVVHSMLHACTSWKRWWFPWRFHIFSHPTTHAIAFMLRSSLQIRKKHLLQEKSLSFIIFNFQKETCLWNTCIYSSYTVFCKNTNTRVTKYWQIQHDKFWGTWKPCTRASIDLCWHWTNISDWFG